MKVLSSYSKELKTKSEIFGSQVHSYERLSCRGLGFSGNRSGAQAWIRRELILAAALSDMAETNLLRGEPLPLPNPALTDARSELEEPIYLLLRAGWNLTQDIGSAAGVAAMGLEQINFLWYLRRIAPWACAGYASGVLVILLQRALS